MIAFFSFHFACVPPVAGRFIIFAKAGHLVVDLRSGPSVEPARFQSKSS
jgi:hypothetical protein